MNKIEIVKIVDELREHGWSVTIGGNCHYKCVPPNRTKPIVFLPSTPSAPSSIPNCKSKIRRAGYPIK